MTRNSRQFCDTTDQLQANMAQFSDLPSEILLLFVEQLLRADIDAFCQLSKRIRAVTASFHRRHMDLKRRYTTRNYMLNWQSNGQFAHLLKDILDNPHGALYTSRLHYNSWIKSRASRGAQPFPSPAPGSQPSETQYLNALQTISNAIRNCAIIPKGCKAEWIQKIERGSEDPLVALVLTMLPNLTNLQLRDASGSYMADIITRIIAQKDSAFLSKLKTVELVPLYDVGSSNLFEDVEVIRKLSLLPSISTITALGYTHCALEDICDLKLTGQNRKSQVFDMSFSICYIDPAILDDLLECTSPLAAFRYRLRKHHFGRHDFNDMYLCDIFGALWSEYIHSL